MQWPERWEVTEATPPQASDRRSHVSYTREANGHRQIAQRRWQESNGLIGYLGEWHSHPEPNASPSRKDIIELAQVSRRLKADLISVVVGYYGGTVMFAHNGRMLDRKPFHLGPTPISIA
jgi:integrative and conjugative element protein (TIGR02256 family)